MPREIGIAPPKRPHYRLYLRLLPIAYCLLPTAYCLLPTAYCLLPTAYSTNTNSLALNNTCAKSDHERCESAGV